MQLQTDEIMRMLADELETMSRSIDQSVNDEYTNMSLKGLFATYTSTIARRIQEAEDRRVCAMLDDMEGDGTAEVPPDEDAEDSEIPPDEDAEGSE